MGCCNSKNKGCICLPYDDPWIVTAIVLALVAFCLSWVWWVTMLINLGVMINFQCLWCGRKDRESMNCAFALAILCGLLSVCVGVYIGLVWDNIKYCLPFFFANDFGIMDCHWKGYASLSIVSGLLWWISAYCIVRFLRSGRHARWEEALARDRERLDNNNNNNNDATDAAVESGTVPSSPPPPQAEATTAAVAIAVPLAEAKD